LSRRALVGIHNIFEQAIGASQGLQYLDHAAEIAERPAPSR
jgi:hypothetical protein